MIDKIQAALNFEKLGRTNEQFQLSGIGKIGTTGFLLGLFCGFHAGLVLLSGSMIAFGGEALIEWHSLLANVLHWSIYATLLGLFHFAEFFTTALCQPASLCFDSFIVNHSKPYTMAALASWAEYWIELYFFGSKKHSALFIVIGVSLVLAGQAVRTAAMWTCGTHFSHQIMEQKRDDHELVTSGIYAYLRHPSYFGWFYWSIGTQILLCNPICVVCYAYASWSFFSARIPFEEELLVKFYKQQYMDYASKTQIGIPFMRTSIAYKGSSKD